jgi:hypothetical protein
LKNVKELVRKKKTKWLTLTQEKNQEKFEKVGTIYKYLIFHKYLINYNTCVYNIGTGRSSQ